MMESSKEVKNRKSKLCLLVLAVLMAAIAAGCSCGTRNDGTNNMGTNESAGQGMTGTDSQEDGLIPGTSETAQQVDQETKETEEPVGTEYILGGEKELRFREGTYEGEATGYAGPILVTVTVSEDRIVGIDAVYESESENVGQVAIPKLIDQIIDSNGSNIDVVSGATYSSKGLLDAVDDALRQAIDDQDR